MKYNLLVRCGIIVIIPAVLMLLFSFFSSGFGPSSTLIILSQTMIPLVMGFGVAFTFIVGIFEMSIGSQVILSAIVGGLLYRYFGLAGLVFGCIGTGIILGCIMGLVYCLLKIPTMVISLGMMMIFEVIGSLLSVGSGYIKVDNEVAQYGKSPYNFLIAGLAGVFFYILYHKTKFGYRARALGNNDHVAVQLGLDNNKIKFQTYVAGGVCYGIAGLLTICYSGSIASKLSLNSMSTVFPPVIAVLIGLQLKGIVNNFALTILVGAFSVTMLFTGLVAVGLPATMQDFMTGLFMLGVMIISTNKDRIFQVGKRKMEIQNVSKN